MAEWASVRMGLVHRRGFGEYCRARGPRSWVRYHLIRVKGGRWRYGWRYNRLCWSRTWGKSGEGLAFEYRGLGRWLVYPERLRMMRVRRRVASREQAQAAEMALWSKQGQRV